MSGGEAEGDEVKEEMEHTNINFLISGSSLSVIFRVNYLNKLVQSAILRRIDANSVTRRHHLRHSELQETLAGKGFLVIVSEQTRSPTRDSWGKIAAEASLISIFQSVLWLDYFNTITLDLCSLSELLLAYLQNSKDFHHHFEWSWASFRLAFDFSVQTKPLLIAEIDMDL